MELAVGGVPAFVGAVQNEVAGAVEGDERFPDPVAVGSGRGLDDPDAVPGGAVVEAEPFAEADSRAVRGQGRAEEHQGASRVAAQLLRVFEEEGLVGVGVAGNG